MKDVCSCMSSTISSRSILITNLLDGFYDFYSEYFNFADFTDLEEYITDDELPILQRSWEKEEGECDAIWQILNQRILKNRKLVNEDAITVSDLKPMVELADYFLTIGLGQVDDGSYHKLFFVDAKEFAPSFIDNVLEDMESVFWLKPLRPFRERLEFVSRLVHRNNWPQNEIVFGRFLEWVNIYNILEEEHNG